MENFKNWINHRRETDGQENRSSRIPAIIGLILTAVFTGIFIYVAASYFGNGQVSSPVIVSERPVNRLLSPNVYVCTTETRPRLIWNRAKREVPNLLKRVARPLSPAPPVFSAGAYDPPLYHDGGAKCAWGRLSGRRVPDVENVGVSYDSQQLGARSCDDPEICKSICLRMHKPDDPYLCNYFTWNREKKVALFYFLEPTIRWNLTQDVRVETFFWQCKATQCTWFWRPHRIHPAFAELTATQMRGAKGLIQVSQCTDFASCQFACETRPSFRDLQEQGQLIPNDVNLDDPTCDYVVMPSSDTRNSFSFLFSMRQGVLKNITYAASQTYDSFELICKDPKKPESDPSSITVAPPPPAIPQKVPVQAQVQGQASTVVVAAPPPQPATVAGGAAAPQNVPQVPSVQAVPQVPQVQAAPQVPPAQPPPPVPQVHSQLQPPVVPVPVSLSASANASGQLVPSEVTAPVAAQPINASAPVSQAPIPSAIQPAPSQPVQPVQVPAQAVNPVTTVQAGTPPSQAAIAPASVQAAVAPALQAAPALAPAPTAAVPALTATSPLAGPAIQIPLVNSGIVSPQPIPPAPPAIPNVAQVLAQPPAPDAAPSHLEPAPPAPGANPLNVQPSQRIINVASLAQARQKRETQPNVDTVHLRECMQMGKVIPCSKVIKDAQLDAPCIQITAEPGHEHVSVSISSKKPVWFSVEQPSLDGLEEHVSLVPGRQHVIDMRLDRADVESSKCGPLSVRGRRCASTCNDRLAIDMCGCSLNTDPDAGFLQSMLSTPLCTDQQLKSCVVDQLRSDAFFDCMNECKKECSTWHPFEFQKGKGSKLTSDDYLVLDLHFPRPDGDVRAEPMWWNRSFEQVMQIWAPALMVLMLLLAVVAVVFVSSRR